MASTFILSESDLYSSTGVVAGLKTAKPIIRLDNLQKTYLLGVEGVPALRGVSLDIAQGEFVCIFGTSGGGKTTMLNILGTIDKPTKGAMELCGKRITPSTADGVTADLRLKNIGFVFQSFNLISSLTAIENVEMPMVLAGVLTAAERRARAEELLARVGMSERMDHLPTQLSGGEQQRVTIARALANQPDVLLLDEPTGDLDTVNSAIVLDLLLSLNEEGITLVMVTHDVGLKWFAERVIWMRDGKIKTVEIVSEERRRQAKAQLQADVDAIQAKRKTLRSETSTEPDSDYSSSSTSFVPTFTNTQIRRPHNYATEVALVPIATPSSRNSDISPGRDREDIEPLHIVTETELRDSDSDQDATHHSPLFV